MRQFHSFTNNRNHTEHMFTEERREKIKELLAKNKSVYIEEIAEKFGVSTVTARKDLKALESEKLLVRTHGGAMTALNSSLDLPLFEKQKLRTREKMAIAKRASAMIRDGEVIILDNGSTSTFIARELKERQGITIITNAVNIASELASSKLDIILTGGNLREKSFSLIGPIAEATLKDITANRYFMSVDGIDFDQGFTTPNIPETKISQMMMKVAKEVIVVADSTKFGQRRTGIIAPIKGVRGIITSKDLSKENQRAVKKCGIELFLV